MGKQRLAIVFLGVLIPVRVGLPATEGGERATVAGLVAYWSLDEGRGDRAANAIRQYPDIFGAAAEARILHPWWTTGRYGSALEFAGDTALIIDKTKSLNCQRQLTIAAWVRPDKISRRAMIVNHEYAYRLALVGSGGKTRVQFQLNLDGRWAGNWLTGKTALDAGRWYHLAAVYDGTERRIYVDGRLDAAEPATGAISAGRNMVLGAQQVRALRKGSPRQRSTQTYSLRESFVGALDEVRIWNRALSLDAIRRSAREGRQAVLRKLGPGRALYLYPVRSVAMSGRDDSFELVAFNSGKTEFRGEIHIRLTTEDGDEVLATTQTTPLPPRATRSIKLSVPKGASGRLRLAASVQGTEMFRTSLYVMKPHGRQPVGRLTLHKVLRVDLTHQLGPDAFCDDGTSRVVRSALGAYREAGPKKFSRFVVRLPLRRTGLHLIRVTYPDDKARTGEIATWSPASADQFNCQSGYFTGGDYPLSMRMRTFEAVIWARDVNQALVFTTWLDGEPAAAAAVDVFEIEGRLPSRPASRVYAQRDIGLYWEDAQPLSRCFGGTAPDFPDFDRMAINLADYFDYTGQNLLMHPLVWYEGPIYNSLVEARGGKGGFYFPTDGWVDILLKRFEEHGLKFIALFNVHQLPSLVRSMNVDMKRIQAGEPTFNTVSGENHVFAKTWHHRLPAFNALHPKVQERVLALVREIAERYGDSPAFGGIGFHLTLASLLQPGSLDVSYDDWTVGAFEKETGVRVPVDAKDVNRFGKRHTWIMAHAREKWIRWRCGRVADFYGKAAEILRSKRRDLKLVVVILEPPMSIIDPQREAWMAGKSQREIAREAGIDPARLAQHPGIVIQKRLGPSAKKKRLVLGVTRSRWGASAPPSAESIKAIRAMDLDPRQAGDFRTTDLFGVFLYNRYFESAVGRQKPIKCNWFGGIPWRASAVAPAGEHFMEYYAQATALFDPNFIAIGGFTNGAVGHEAQVERFARIFRQLPSGKWTKLPDVGPNVVARELRLMDTRYVYAVNPSQKTQRINVQAARGLVPIGGSPALAEDNGVVALSPYELAAWKTK